MTLSEQAIVHTPSPNTFAQKLRPFPKSLPSTYHQLRDKLDESRNLILVHMRWALSYSVIFCASNDKGLDRLPLAIRFHHSHILFRSHRDHLLPGSRLSSLSMVWQYHMVNPNTMLILDELLTGHGATVELALPPAV